MMSLWGESFEIKDTKKTAKQLLSKIKKPKEIKNISDYSISKNLDLDSKLAIINENVLKILGRFKDTTEVIKTRSRLSEYIDKAIQNGVIAIDTETNNSLDPLTCTLMGPCLYTPNEKSAYIPLNHIDSKTKERFDWQLTEQDIKEEFERLDKTKIIMHNGKFDYSVIKCTIGSKLNVYWDTMIGSFVLDENDRSHGLKQQYISKIDPSMEKYTIDKLFTSIEYAVVDPEIFALYAATDSFMTFKLYEFQKNIFEQLGNEKLYSLFKEVEMPVVTLTAEIELTGVCLDLEYQKLLSNKYHKKLEKADKDLEDELAKLKDKIDAWRKTPEANEFRIKEDGKRTKSKNEQLKDPILLTSPLQLAILLYDILDVGVIDTKSPRSTDEKVLKTLNIPICKKILAKRSLMKLLSTYIDKLPECINEKDGRLHGIFNQYGAVTGRYSSDSPNLQNIPSQNKEIRMMFKATDGYLLKGSDFSAQEPRLLAVYSGDEIMYKNFLENKDVYATVAATVFKNDYWDNLEFRQDGTRSKEGKERRSKTKSILLGLMYGRGVWSIAEQIKGTVQDAQNILDQFFNNFPKVKKWIDETHSFAKKYGYVEDYYGRRRRLPDIVLPEYEFKIKDRDESIDPTFNPLLDCSGIIENDQDWKIEYYKDKIKKCLYKNQVKAIIKRALKEGIIIKDNTGFIAQAERQAVNARVQGGAATQTKLALIKISKNEELKRLGFRVLLLVHDEIIGECPIENEKRCGELLAECMRTSLAEITDMPFKCDVETSTCWYLADFFDLVKSEYYSLIDSEKTKMEAFNIIVEERTESTVDQIHEILDPIMLAI